MTRLALTTSLKRADTGTTTGRLKWQTAGHYRQGATIPVGMIEITIPVDPTISDPGFFYVMNHTDPAVDPTNYVDIGYSTGLYRNRLYAGEPGLIPLALGTAALYVVASDAATKFQYEITERVSDVILSSSSASASQSSSGSSSSSESSPPSQLYLDWLDNVETRAAYWIATYPPPTGAPQSFLGWQLNYDSVHTYVRLSKIFASSNPSLSQDCLDYAAAHIDPEIYEYPPNPTYPNPREGGLMTEPPFSGPPGSYNYNLGPQMLGAEQSLSAPFRETCRRITCGFARAAAYSHSEIETWDPVWWQFYYAMPPTLCREFALALLAHLVADDWYSEFENRSWQGMTYVQAHSLYMPNILRIFLDAGGWVDKWRTITADLAAAGGVWADVPNTWENNGYEYTPFMWAHTCRALIYYYEDPMDNSRNAEILDAVVDLCDAAIAYFRRPTTLGNYAFIYRIPDGGADKPILDIEGDLALLEMPMFAWAWSKTGNPSYYNMCVELVTTGNAEAAWYYSGKWFNQQNLWAWYGFQWLVWVPDPFAVFWRA